VLHECSSARPGHSVDASCLRPGSHYWSTSEVTSFSTRPVSHDSCGLLCVLLAFTLTLPFFLFLLAFYTICSSRLNPSDRLLVIVALERLGTASGSQDGVSSEARYAPTGERAYLRRLIARHGTDIAGMAKDRKLNWEQRTEGELRRGLRRSGFVPA
jgi:hypothetical protein